MESKWRTLSKKENAQSAAVRRKAFRAACTSFSVPKKGFSIFSAIKTSETKKYSVRATGFTQLRYTLYLQYSKFSDFCKGGFAQIGAVFARNFKAIRQERKLHANHRLKRRHKLGIGRRHHIV